MKMEFGNKNVRVKMEDDRISSLPDGIIHHILSFNDTQFAVQTSVLSSRWKLIWTTLPYLNLYSGAFRTLRIFSKFVNSVLSLRNHQTEVSSLGLCFRGTPDQKIMQEIASYVVSHNVQKVNIFALELKGSGDRVLPLCFFNSQSLRHMSIKAHLHWNRITQIPQSFWDSPALTTVELTNVKLCLGNTTCLDLFSKCLNLMNLTLTGCGGVQLKCMKILCPRLVCLSISNCRPSTYEILAPNLSSFHYNGAYPRISFTGGLNSLEKVNLCVDSSGLIYSNEQMQSIAHEFMNMLCELRHAKVVILHGQVIECLRIEGVETQRKPTKSDLRTQVINYLLNSSPTATVNLELPKTHETVKDGSSKRQLLEKPSGEGCNNPLTGISQLHLTTPQPDIESDGESNYYRGVGDIGTAEIGVVSGDDIDEETSRRVEVAHASEVGTRDEGQGCDHDVMRSTKLPVGRSLEFSVVVPVPLATSVDVGFTQSSGSLAGRDSGRGVASTSLERNVRQGIVQHAHDLHLGTAQSCGDGRVTWRGHLVKDQYVRLLTAIEVNFPWTFDKLRFRTEDMWEVALNSFGSFMSTFLSTDVEHLDDHVKVRLEGLLQDCEHFGFVIGWAFDRLSLVMKLKNESPLPRELSALDMEIAKVVCKEKALEQELASLRAKRSELEAARGAKVREIATSLGLESMTLLQGKMGHNLLPGYQLD